MPIISRRSFVAGLFAAPAVIAYAKLMPVKALAMPDPAIDRLRQEAMQGLVTWSPPSGLWRVVGTTYKGFDMTEASTFEGFFTDEDLTANRGVTLFTLPAGSMLKSVEISAPIDVERVA